MFNQQDSDVLFKFPRNSMMRLWNSIVMMDFENLKRFLAKMRLHRLFGFLNFMRNACIHDHTIDFSEERLKHFQVVMMYCPRARLTRFLISIDEQSLVNLLERCDVIWTMFFVGLINRGQNSDIIRILNFLMEVYDVKFGVDLLLLLEREAKNQERCLSRDLRQKIFNFFCLNWNELAYVVQVNHGQEMTQDINDLVSLMNSWMRDFSFNHGLKLNPRLFVEIRFFTRN